jgi:hypothetical protein
LGTYVLENDYSHDELGHCIECGYESDDPSEKICTHCNEWLMVTCPTCYGQGGGEVWDPVGYGPFDSPAYEHRWDECTT